MTLTQCPYENVSLNFYFFKCCEDMSQMDMSNRPRRPNKMRGERESSTSSARREKQALRPPMAGRERGGHETWCS